MTKQIWHQYGFTLVVSLVMLLVLTMLSTSLINLVLMDQKAVRNQRDKHIAMQAAESALADAEKDIENSAATNSRSTLFSPHSSEGFIVGCSLGEKNYYQGLCMRAERNEPPIWTTADIANTGNSSTSVQFGRFTGQTMPVGAGPFPSQLPRYIIELLHDPFAEESTDTRYVYRITAIGFGVDRSTQIVLQSVYRKAGQGHSTLKPGRLSWREISNWRDGTDGYEKTLTISGQSLPQQGEG